MKKLLKFGIFAAIVAGIVRFVATQKAEWQNLSETELRAKMESKMSGRMPPEKLEQMQDKVVSTMRARGMLREDEAAAETG